MTQIVEADFLQAMFFQHNLKVLRNIIRLYQISQLIHIHILQILFAVRHTTSLAVSLLLLFQAMQQFCKWWNKRERTIAGLRFSTVLLYHNFLSLYKNLGDGMFNGEGLFFKVDCLPFQASNLTSAQAIKCSQNYPQFNRVSVNCLKKLFQLFLIVNRRNVPDLPWSFYTVRRIRFDQPNLKSVLKAFPNVCVSMNNGIRGQSCVQLMLVIILYMFWFSFKVLKREPFAFKERDYALFHTGGI